MVIKELLKNCLTCIMYLLLSNQELTPYMTTICFKWNQRELLLLLMSKHKHTLSLATHLYLQTK